MTTFTNSRGGHLRELRLYSLWTVHLQYCWKVSYHPLARRETRIACRETRVWSREMRFLSREMRFLSRETRLLSRETLKKLLILRLDFFKKVSQDYLVECRCWYSTTLLSRRELNSRSSIAKVIDREPGCNRNRACVESDLQTDWGLFVYIYTFNCDLNRNRPIFVPRCTLYYKSFVICAALFGEWNLIHIRNLVA